MVHRLGRLWPLGGHQLRGALQIRPEQLPEHSWNQVQECAGVQTFCQISPCSSILHAPKNATPFSVFAASSRCGVVSQYKCVACSRPRNTLTACSTAEINFSSCTLGAGHCEPGSVPPIRQSVHRSARHSELHASGLPHRRPAEQRLHLRLHQLLQQPLPSRVPEGTRDRSQLPSKAHTVLLASMCLDNWLCLFFGSFKPVCWKGFLS